MRGAAYSPSRKRKLAILTSTRHSCFRYAAISFYSWKQKQFYIPVNEMNTTQNKYFNSLSEWNKIFLKRLKIEITNLRVLVTKSFIIKYKRTIMWKTLIIQSTLFEVDRFLSSAYAFPGSVQSISIPRPCHHLHYQRLAQNARLMSRFQRTAWPHSYTAERWEWSILHVKLTATEGRALLQVPSKELTDHILKLSVIDAGRTKRRSVIGYVTFPLRDLPAENEQILYKMDLEKVCIF